MSADRLRETLQRQRVVDGLVSGRHGERHELLELLVRRQHDAALDAQVTGSTDPDLASVLDALAFEDARALWARVPEDRRPGVLRELGEARRQELAPGVRLDFGTGRVVLWRRVDGRLESSPVGGVADLDVGDPVWIDVIGASRTERASIARRFGVTLPEPMDEASLDVSARYFVDEHDGLHLRSNFLDEQPDGSYRLAPVAFMVSGGILYSVRNRSTPALRPERQAARRRGAGVSDCVAVLLELFRLDVERSADALELGYAALGRIGRTVLDESVSDAEAAATLSDVADIEARNGLIRGNLLDTQRALGFLVRGRALEAEAAEDVRRLLADIASLNEHTAFLFEKINFVMDATIGYINVNQNRRVSQLTALSVVFMPLNMMAGIGGMSEFTMMTEGIAWPWAYAGFVLGCGALGALTYAVLRRLERRATSISRR